MKFSKLFKKSKIWNINFQNSHSFSFHKLPICQKFLNYVILRVEMCLMAFLDEANVFEVAPVVHLVQRMGPRTEEEETGQVYLQLCSRLDVGLVDKLEEGWSKMS